MSLSSKLFVQCSKFLSWALRHNAHKVKLTIDKNGWAKTTDVLTISTAHTPVPLTMELLEEIVARDSKGRFEFNEDKTCIRACQGHSHKLGLSMDDLPQFTAAHVAQWEADPSTRPFIVHGTTREAFDIIRASGGLSIMSRMHIHFAMGATEMDAIKRTRPKSTVFLFLDVARCIAHGIKVYISTNNVVLTSGIDGVLPLDFIDHILD